MVSFINKFLFLFTVIELLRFLHHLDLDYDDYFFRLFQEEYESYIHLEMSLAGLNDTVFDQCILRSNPVWTDEMRKLLHPTYDPLKNCDRTYLPWSTLNEDGRISIRSEFRNDVCSARALHFKDEYTNEYGEWHKVEEQFVFENDIVEVQCVRNGAVSYKFLHSQIWTGGKSDMPVISNPSSDEKPSVYIMLLDSFGASHAKRVFPKTLQFLKDELEAVEMHHLNKVGENSSPNGFSLLLGKTIDHIYRDIWGLPNIIPDLNYSQFCNQFLDDEPFIMKEFEKQGYKTMMAEDWAQGVFNWPKCKGFKKPPATHYMRPFQLRMESSERQIHQGKANCFESFQFLQNYLRKFMNAYSDTPKFALYWDTLGHNYSNEPFHADTEYLDFLKQNKQELDNSFLFFMADHGLRFGKMSYTPSGRRDVNNPMLYISVPRRLRNDVTIIQNLKTNSNKLLTMFDVHATLVDILESLNGSAKPQFKETIKKTNLKGTSILRPLPLGTRNCKTLPIPFEYCICHLEMPAVPVTNEFAGIGKAVANAINTQLRKFNVHEHCAKLEPDETTELNIVKGSRNLYQATVRLKPSGGLYKTFVRDSKGQFEVVFPDITRLDSYGRQANCIERNDIRPLCYCRANNLLSFIKGLIE